MRMRKHNKHLICVAIEPSHSKFIAEELRINSQCMDYIN